MIFEKKNKQRDQMVLGGLKSWNRYIEIVFSLMLLVLSPIPGKEIVLIDYMIKDEHGSKDINDWTNLILAVMVLRVKFIVQCFFNYN